ncbi:MAG: hypothetical protein VB949_17010 [Pseudomonadales bacterium]
MTRQAFNTANHPLTLDLALPGIADEQPWQGAVPMRTANVLAYDRASCTDAGMNDFIPKPVRLNDVCEALERALEITGNL